MISVENFIEELNVHDIKFYTGIPDSLLKSVCAYISDNSEPNNNIIAANEGAAIAIAAGYNLATEKIPLVYMQNSGIGNAINPLLSLVDYDVYNIPILMLIGWRGEPGIKDEPQHVKQGKITLELLDTMKIKYEILPQKSSSLKKCINNSISYIKKTNRPLALVVKKNTFSKYSLSKNNKSNFMKREDVLEYIVSQLSKDDIIVSTTGKTSREIFEIREKFNNSHEQDFLTVGSMGHANQIALGIALQKKDRNIYCIDGDGALIMHAGSLGIIGDLAPENFKHILINNGAHDSVGGQKTIAHNIDICSIAKDFNYKKIYKVEKEVELKTIFTEFKNNKGPVFLEIIVKKGSRKELGRPNISPKENKKAFIKFLKNGTKS